MSLPILYASDKKGRIKQWQVITMFGYVDVRYGLKDGKETVESYQALPKNVGRSNETTAHEQAELEAQSKWNKQIKKGYVENVEDVGQKTLPPLAKKYQDAKSALKWPLLGLLKLDGVRCTMFHKDGEVTFQSRGGDPYPVIQEIADELIESIFKVLPDAVVDGELYKHGMYLEDIVSAVKKHKESTSEIEFHVFDIYFPDKKHTYLQRTNFYSMLLRGAKGLTDLCKRVKTIQPVVLNTEQEMLGMHAKAVVEGYEGVVLRNMNGLFEFNHRTSDFQKYKVACSNEFLVVDMEKDKRGGGVPVCGYHFCDKKLTGTFKATFAGTLETRKNLYEDKELYIGKYLTVDYEKLSKYGKPTKPVGKMFRRLDEDGKPEE